MFPNPLGPPRPPLTLVKVAEAAKVLACSRATVRSLIDCGDLSVVPLTPGRRKVERRHVRIVRSSLDDFVARRRT